MASGMLGSWWDWLPRLFDPHNPPWAPSNIAGAAGRAQEAASGLVVDVAEGRPPGGPLDPYGLSEGLRGALPGAVAGLGDVYDEGHNLALAAFPPARLIWGEDPAKRGLGMLKWAGPAEANPSVQSGYEAGRMGGRMLGEMMPGLGDVAGFEQARNLMQVDPLQAAKVAGLTVLPFAGDLMRAAGKGADLLSARGAFSGPSAGSPAAQRGAIGVATGGPSPLDLARQFKHPGITPLDQLPRRRGGKAPGQYIGGPRGVTTPEAVEDLAQEYADRIEYALDNGVSPGYFYRRAGETIEEMSGGVPKVKQQIVGTSALYSPQNKVLSERMMSGYALEQADQVGEITKGGRFPGPMSKRANNLMEQTEQGGQAQNVIGGDKIGPYSDAAQGNRLALGANDQWENYAVFGDKSAPTEAGHVFLHSLRQRAAEIVHQRRGQVLLPSEAQELNWITTKSQVERKTLQQIMEQETYQGAVPWQSTYQTWETMPGKNPAIRHLEGMTKKEASQYHRGMTGVLLDPQTGRDRLIDAMGSRQQMKAAHGPGYYFPPDSKVPEINPGVTSIGVGGQKVSGGQIEPITAARVTANERVRGLALGQDSIAATMLNKGSPQSAFRINKSLTPAQAKTLGRRLNEVFGGDAGFINTPEGIAVVSFGAKGFSKDFNSAIAPDLRRMLGNDVEISPAGVSKAPGEDGLLFEQVPWGGPGKSPVTKGMLEAIDNPIIPRMAEHADSPKMRALMGEMAGYYDKMRASGQIPSEKIQLVLKTWAERGLAGVRELVKIGAAPAVAYAIVAGAQNEEPLRQPGV